MKTGITIAVILAALSAPAAATCYRSPYSTTTWCDDESKAKPTTLHPAPAPLPNDPILREQRIRQMNCFLRGGPSWSQGCW